MLHLLGLVCDSIGMPKRSSKSKRPRDTNQLAKRIVDIATNEKGAENSTNEGKNPAAVQLGRLGGQKGGVARAKSLSARRRKEIARKAASARWQKDDDD